MSISHPSILSFPSINEYPSNLLVQYHPDISPEDILPYSIQLPDSSNKTNNKNSIIPSSPSSSSRGPRATCGSCGKKILKAELRVVVPAILKRESGSFLPSAVHFHLDGNCLKRQRVHKMFGRGNQYEYPNFQEQGSGGSSRSSRVESNGNSSSSISSISSGNESNGNYMKLSISKTLYQTWAMHASYKRIEEELKTHRIVIVPS